MSGADITKVPIIRVAKNLNVSIFIHLSLKGLFPCGIEYAVSYTVCQGEIC